MGLFRRSSLGCTKPPNPNPFRFKILKLEVFKNYCVCLLHYPGCTTYYGKKVAVYNIPKETLENAKKLDPHFIDKELAPIARFPGDQSGWDNAIKFVLSL